MELRTGGGTHPYGSSPEQVADLRLPAGDAPAAGWPVVVLIHGGFWRDGYRRDRPTGGGVPATLEDVAAGVDALEVVAEAAPIDLARVSVVGHSAGGHLALWVAGRVRLPPGVPGADPRVVPCAAVGQAPITSLHAGGSLGAGAVGDFLGGTPEEVPARYAYADPIGLVGHGIPVLLVHGDADDVVPIDQSERYDAAAGAAGDPVRLVPASGDHDTVVDPGAEAWAVVVRFLEERG